MTRDLSRRLVAATAIIGLTAGSGGLAVTAAQAQDAPEAPEIADMDAPFFVTWMSANVRAEPDSTSAVIEALAFGDVVTVTGEVVDTEWLRVELAGGGVGYVWAEVLSPARLLLPGGEGQPPAPGPGPGPTPPAPDTLGPSADNSFDTANPVSPPGSTPQDFYGFLGPSDEVDYYRFTVEEWTDLVVTMDQLTSDADIALLDQDGNYLADSIAGGSSPELIEFSVAPGTYYVEAYIYSGETEYHLTIAGEAGEAPPDDMIGDTPETAEPLGTIGAGSGTLTGSDWVGFGDASDYWRLDVEAPTSVTLTMTGLSSDIDIVLEDDFGSVLGSSAAGGSADEFIETQLQPGTYYIHVYPFTGGSEYTLTLDYQTGAEAPEDGAGNSQGTARDLGAVGPEPIEVEDWVGPADTNDYYVIEVPETGAVRITLAPFESDADVELLDGDGNYIAASIRPGTESELIEETLEAGTYYIRAYIYSGETGYTLGVVQP